MQPIEDTTATHIWFHEKGLLLPCTTLDWTGVKGLYSGFTKSTCHYFGKVKDVIPKKESMVTAQKGESMVTAQGLFDQYVSNSSRACKVTVHAYTCLNVCFAYTLNNYHHNTYMEACRAKALYTFLPCLIAHRVTASPYNSGWHLYSLSCMRGL